MNSSWEEQRQREDFELQARSLNCVVSVQQGKRECGMGLKGQ